MRDTSFLDDLFPGKKLGTPSVASAEHSAEASQPAKAPEESPYRFLPLDAVAPDPEQPRKSFTEDGLQELADSIISHGVLQPILVEPDGDKYKIVAGERRWRAACLARDRGEPCGQPGYDLSGIPAVVTDSLENTVRLEKQLVENLAREDMSPQDTGRALAVLVAAGVTQAEISRRLGKSAGWVRQMLALVNPELAGIAARLGVPLEDVSTPYYAQRILALSEEETERLAAWLAEGKPLSRELLGQLKKPVETELVSTPILENVREPSERTAEAVDLVDHGDEPEEPGDAEDSADSVDPSEESEDNENLPARALQEDPASKEEVVAEPVAEVAGDFEGQEAPVEPTLSICLPVSLWQALLDKADVDGEPTSDSVQVAVRYFAGFEQAE